MQKSFKKCKNKTVNQFVIYSFHYSPNGFKPSLNKNLHWWKRNFNPEKLLHKTPVLLSKSCLVCNFRVIFVKRLLTSEKDIGWNAALGWNLVTAKICLNGRKIFLDYLTNRP